MGISPLRNTSQLRRTVLLRTVRLVIYSTKVHLPEKRRHLLQRQSCVLPVPDSAITAVWLAKSAGGMICWRHEASIFPPDFDAQCRYRRANSHQLFNAANTNVCASRYLPEYFTQRPGACNSGTNSHRDVTTRRVAGVGFARSKNYR